LLAQPNGIILLTGPTGCGKSTSLYCYLSTINSVSRRIITIEEPVEYKLPGVLQMDVKPEIDFTFARGLRHILRRTQTWSWSAKSRCRNSGHRDSCSDDRPPCF